jgi:hypothetical protein
MNELTNELGMRVAAAAFALMAGCGSGSAGLSSDASDTNFVPSEISFELGGVPVTMNLAFASSGTVEGFGETWALAAGDADDFFHILFQGSTITTGTFGFGDGTANVQVQVSVSSIGMFFLDPAYDSTVTITSVSGGRARGAFSIHVTDGEPGEFETKATFIASAFDLPLHEIDED